MRKININKVIKKIERLKLSENTSYYSEHFNTDESHPDWYNQALINAIQIIKDNIREIDGDRGGNDDKNKTF